MKKITLCVVIIGSLVGRADEVPWWKNIIGFAQRASDSGSLTFAVYPGWSPNLTVEGRREPWGAGAAALYRLSDHVLTGARFDWLADSFWSPSVSVSLEADVQLFPTTLNLNLTPFTLAGAAIPVGGAGNDNGEPGAIFGGGFYATVLKLSDHASLQVFYAYERWSGLNADVHRPGVAFTWRF